jgi:serine/threonine protein phosphatase PrpC
LGQEFFSPGEVGGTMPTQAINYAGLSDTGRQRSTNQDRWGADDQQGLFIVADGVASSSHGDRAAEMVVNSLPIYLQRHLDSVGLDDPAAPERLGGAIAEISKELSEHGATDSELAGASTTVVALVVEGLRALVAHLGDSRGYLYRDQQLYRLTRDHSLVQALIDAGEVEPQDAPAHPSRNVITRHVGMPPPAHPDVGAVDLQPSDRIMLCSDGLHGVVNDASLAEILGAARSPGDTCAALIAAANTAGGPDNITTIVIDIAGEQAPPPD